MAESVTCDGCEKGCQEDVEVVDRANGSPEAYVVCHERGWGRIRADLRRLATWVVSGQGLARWLASQIDASPGLEECIAGRLWWLGRLSSCENREAFLAVGSARSDAQSLFPSCLRLQEAQAPLVFVPAIAPSPFPFGRQPRVILLLGAVRSGDGRFILDDLQLTVSRAGADKPDAILLIDGPDVTFYGQPVKLEPRDRELLRVLALNVGQWLSDPYLRKKAWAAYQCKDEGAVKGSIYRARNALERAAESATIMLPMPARALFRNEPRALGRPRKYMLALDESQVRASKL